MTRRQLLAGAADRLERAGVPSPRVDAELLLAYVLDSPRAALLVGADPTSSDQARFTELVERRATRVPLQHLTGTAPFRHLELKVGPGVFIPRPETELLAGWVIDVARRLEAPVVVDLCTGSGAIAAAVAAEAPDALVYAVELDEVAYGYAADNLAGTGVDLRHGDIADAFGDLDARVDLVVANPPYIPLSAYEGVDAEAREHDPALALWSGEDGLDAVRVVEATAARLLVGGGRVGCEHADAQGDAVPAIFAASGRWVEIGDHDDLAGRPRFTTARRIERALGI